MKPAILLLAAAATIGAAPARPGGHAAPAPEARYEAGGFEPTWSLVIESGWLSYNPGTNEWIRVRVPPRQAVRNGYRYIVSPQLTVDVRHVRCDSYNGQTFADTVTVTGVEEPGCGGVAIPPDTLRYTSWEVTFVDGTPVARGSLNFFFEGDGRLTGHAGCSDFVMSYREQRPLLRLGPMRVTRRDCDAPGADIERRALQILAGTLRMSFFDGDSLRLSGSRGVLRAQN